VKQVGGLMTFCPNCGTENGADSKFCIKCWKSLSFDKLTEKSIEYSTISKDEHQISSNNKGSKKKHYIIFGIAILLVVILGSVLSDNSKDDVSRYFDWSFTTSNQIFDMYTSNTYSNYVTAPPDHTYVTVTLHIHNTGNKPIFTADSHWEFISDRKTYSPDTSVNLDKGSNKIMVEPGEDDTFDLIYLVEGNPQNVKLVYTPS
jgi:archaellum component FlaG (FlaF/FlaG flagellin family)